MFINSDYKKNITDTNKTEKNNREVKKSSQNKIKNNSHNTGKTLNLSNLSSANIENNDINNAYYKNNIIKEALRNLGFNFNSENKLLVDLLLKNNFPVNKETILNINHAIKLVGSSLSEKPIFFMKNDIKPNFETLNTLNNILNKNYSLDKQLSNIITDTIIHLPQSTADKVLKALSNNVLSEGTKDNLISIKAEIKNILSTNINNLNIDDILKDNNTETNIKNNLDYQTTDNIIQNILNKIDTDDYDYIKTALYEKLQQNNNAENLKDIINNIFEDKDINLKQALEFIFKNNKDGLKKLSELINSKTNLISKFIKPLFLKPEDTEIELQKQILNISEKIKNAQKILQENATDSKKVLNNFENMSNTSNFISSLKNTYYFSFPMSINNNDTSLELYIFNDKKNSNKNNNSKITSALLSLNLLSLGHFETYIQNNNSYINCQFRVENDNIKKIVTENIQTLNKLLKDYNYTLESYSFKLIDEPFTLLSEKPFDEKEHIKTTSFYIDTKA